MNILLDTHVLLWSLLDKKKLSQKAVSLLLEADNTVHVSTLCFWEISLKYGIGKLELTGVAPEDLPAYAKEAGFSLFPFSAEDAASFYKLPNIDHQDPFDRMIIWQAIRHKAVLLSKDRSFKRYEDLGLHVMW